MDDAPWSRLEALLGLSGVSAREIDRLAGRSGAPLSLIISRQQRALRDDVICAYARVFGCTAGWLVAGEGPAPTADDVIAAIARARETRPVGADHTASDFTTDNAVGPEAA